MCGESVGRWVPLTAKDTVILSSRGEQISTEFSAAQVPPCFCYTHWPPEGTVNPGRAAQWVLEAKPAFQI